MILTLSIQGQNCDPPEVTIAGIEEEVCINDDPYPLQFSPPGGLFRIGDIEMTEPAFDPAAVGPGTHTLIYIYQFNPDCAPIIFSKPIIVNELPEISIDRDTTITCSMDRVVLAANASDNSAAISWEFDGTQVSAASTYETMAPGLYTARAVTSSCRTFRQVNVVLDTMSPVFNSLGYQVVDCNKQVFQLEATADVEGGAFAWSQPSGFYAEENSPTVEALGAYTVMYTDPGNGCTSEAEIVVTAPITGLDFGFTEPSCPEIPDGQIEINGVAGNSPPYLYALNGEPYTMDSLFLGLAEGDFRISVQDFYGCTVDTSINLVASDGISVSLPEPEIVPFSENISISPNILPVGENIVQFNWTVNDSTACPDCTSLELVANDNLSIVFEAVNDEGCRATGTTTIAVDKTPRVFAPNVFSPNGDQKNDEFCLFGNPVISNIAEFRVFDRWGNVVFERTNQPIDGSACWDGSMGGELVSTGTYLFALTLNLATGGDVQYSGSITVLR